MDRVKGEIYCLARVERSFQGEKVIERQKNPGKISVAEEEAGLRENAVPFASREFGRKRGGGQNKKKKKRLWPSKESFKKQGAVKGAAFKRR